MEKVIYLEATLHMEVLCWWGQKGYSNPDKHIIRLYGENKHLRFHNTYQLEVYRTQ